MTNRLEFFRQQMAAFEGTSDPQKAIERGYYIEQPRNSLASNIAAKISLRPTSRHLLIGGIGSGKTTQLLMIRDLINQIEDFHPHYVDVSLYTDISEIKPGSLLAITGLILSTLMDYDDDFQEKRGVFIDDDCYYCFPSEEHTDLENAIDYIKKYAYGYQKEVDFEVDLVEKGIIQYSGVLRFDSNIENKYKQIYESVKKIKEYLFPKSTFLVLLFDGLDRFNDNESMLTLIQADIELISRLGIGVVLVGSISLNYSNYQETVKQVFNNNIHYQPYFDIENDSEAYDFLDNILTIRSSENFMQISAKKLLITYSGGILRDLINLTQTSIEEAYFSDSDILEDSHVNAAINSFSQAKILGISNPELEILEKVAKGETFLPRTDEHIHLLIIQAILEYYYPKRRYAVHPALLPLIEKTLA